MTRKQLQALHTEAYEAGQDEIEYVSDYIRGAFIDWLNHTVNDPDKLDQFDKDLLYNAFWDGIFENA